jgi:hypothetical protein
MRAGECTAALADAPAAVGALAAELLAAAGPAVRALFAPRG